MSEHTKSRRRYVIGVGALLATAGCLGQRSGGESETSLPNEPDGTQAIAPITKVDSLPEPVRGDPDADVTVAAYEDFSCPHCRDYTRSTLPKVVDEFIEPEEIRYERYDFPIPVDERWSWAAASAARAVQDGVGVDAFWRYSDLLYEKQGAYTYELIAELAERVDADPETVRTAAEEEVYRGVVETDRKQGRERGVTGTPTVFVNGRSVDSTFDAMQRAIRDELDASG
jgi:protein-disulfide isomerase